MAAAVEVYEMLKRDLSFWITGRSEFLGSIVVAVDVGLVVFRVVKFHDLARDGGFEGGIVI